MADREVSLRMSLNADGVGHGVDLAKRKFKELAAEMLGFERVAAGSIGSMGSGLAILGGVASAVVAGGAAMAGAVRVAANYGDEIANLSERTGLAAGELSRLAYAAKLSDTSTEALGKGVGYLSNLIVAAANGAKESVSKFEKFGITVRNTDGTVRSAGDVLGDLADVFSRMPDGPEKTAIAIDFFGKRLGQELIPLLNQGRAGLKAMGDEAERLGLVLSDAEAKAAAEFNDNLDRMAALAKSVGVNVGGILIPAINEYLGKLSAANKSGLGFLDRLFVGLRDGKDPSQMVSELTAQLETLRKKRDELSKAGGFNFQISGVTEEIEATTRRLEYFKVLAGDTERVERETAAKRVNIVSQMTRDMTQLEQLRAIAAGKANTDILKDDKARVTEQLKDAEKLRAALQAAWETSRKEAAAAADEAKKILKKAADVKQSSADKAQEIRDNEAGYSEEDKAQLAYQRGTDAFDQGRYYTAAAGAARLDGRLQQFKDYQEKAEAFLARAETFAGKSGNADLIEGVGNEQSTLMKEQAKVKTSESTDLTAQAEAQAGKLKELDGQIEQLKVKAASIEIKANVSQLEGAVASALNELSKLPATKEITIVMKRAEQALNPAPEQTTGFSSGGWTGSGSKYQPAGIVHANEFVTRSEIVRQPGALAFLDRFNRLGMHALKGYADGGLVSRLALPSLRSGAAGGGSTTAINLTLDGNRYAMSASSDVAAALTDYVRREAMRKGSRR